MEIIQYINTNLSGILSVLVAAITAIITLVYVVFTFKQMKAAQKSAELASEQMRISNQPCVVVDILKTRGSPCILESTRRQLLIELELENIGDSPALEIYTLSHFELQHTKNVSDGTNIVNMYFYPDYRKYLKADTKETVSVRYETDEIHMLVEDLRYCYEKNMSRIRHNPSKHPYHGTILVVEVYYKNLLGQWFKNTFRQEIYCLVDDNTPSRKTNNLDENNIPPCALGRNTAFTLSLIAPRFSASGIELVNVDEVKKQLTPFKEVLDLSSITS